MAPKPYYWDLFQIFFIYPTWVKENCKKISDKNTVCNMVKIHFEKYEKFKKIQNFEPVRKWELADHKSIVNNSNQNSNEILMNPSFSNSETNFFLGHPVY